MSRPILPVPQPVIAHHEKTLLPSMKEWVEQSRIPPVLLLTGTAGIGKRDIAYHLAQWILCERSGFSTSASASNSADEGESLFGGDLFGADTSLGGSAEAKETASAGRSLEPCGKCTSCQRALHGNWVDFKEILPEEEGGTLKIDQFRELKGSMGFGAHESGYRITLIPNADRMTPQAANSVLKLLEEPPRGWIFFLTASDPTLVLPTVLSRCQTIRLRPLNTETIQELLALDSIDPRRRTICARLAHGSWAKALAMADDEVWEERKILFDFLKSPHECVNPLLDWATQNPSHFDLLLDQLENLTWDLIRSTLASPVPNWVNEDGATALSAHAQAVIRAKGGRGEARNFWTARAERIATARQQSLAPLNRKLLVQDILLPWLEAGLQAGK